MDPSEWDWTRIVVDHVDVHASDYPESVRFYETVLAPLGIPTISKTEESACFTNLNVVAREPATTGLHLCFHARSREQVDEFHAAGVDGGFRSNGEPGYRDYGPGYYAAYLLDPDGQQHRSSLPRRRKRRPRPRNLIRAEPGFARRSKSMPEPTGLKKGAHGGNLVSPVLAPPCRDLRLMRTW